MLKKLAWLFYTELLLCWRRSQEWLYPLSFFIIVTSLFPLAFTPDPSFLQKYSQGSIWIAALLASLISIQTIFYANVEDGEIEQLVLSELPLPVILFAKLGAIWVSTQLPLILITPLLGFLFQLSLSTIFVLCLTLLIGTPILIFVGALCVSLTLGLKQQGTLLGFLILPLVTPVLIFGATITQQVQAGFSISGGIAFLSALCLLSISFLPLAIASTLRVSLDE